MYNVNLHGAMNPDARNRELLGACIVGETLLRAYEVAAALSPAVTDVAVDVNQSTQFGSFSVTPGWSFADGRHRIHIPTIDEAWLGNIDAAVVSMGSNRKIFADGFGIAESELTPEVFAVCGLLHELGHTDDYAEFSDRQDEFWAITDSDFDTLPFGPVWTSQLSDVASAEHWRVRNELEQGNLPPEISSMEDVYRVQHSAYRRLTFEASADGFVRSVLAADPELIKVASD